MAFPKIRLSTAFLLLNFCFKNRHLCPLMAFLLFLLTAFCRSQLQSEVAIFGPLTLLWSMWGIFFPDTLWNVGSSLAVLKGQFQRIVGSGNLGTVLTEQCEKNQKAAWLPFSFVDVWYYIFKVLLWKTQWNKRKTGQLTASGWVVYLIKQSLDSCLKMHAWEQNNYKKH